MNDYAICGWYYNKFWLTIEPMHFIEWFPPRNSSSKQKSRSEIGWIFTQHQFRIIKLIYKKNIELVPANVRIYRHNWFFVRGEKIHENSTNEFAFIGSSLSFDDSTNIINGEFRLTLTQQKVDYCNGKVPFGLFEFIREMICFLCGRHWNEILWAISIESGLNWCYANRTIACSFIAK